MSKIGKMQQLRKSRTLNTATTAAASSQYLMCPPLAFKQASMREGIDASSFRRMAGEIDFQMALTRSNWSVRDEALRFSLACDLNLFFTIRHRFSRGLRLRDWEGHSMRERLRFLSRIMSPKHFFDFLAVCLGSLSCIKISPLGVFFLFRCLFSSDFCSMSLFGHHYHYPSHYFVEKEALNE